MTAPWLPRAADDVLASSIECVVQLEAVHPTLGTKRLELVTASLSYDEDRSPHVYLHGAIAYSADAVALLDPRALTKLRVHTGYVYPGRIRDVHPIAEPILDSAVITRRDGTVLIEIDAMCDEVLLGDPWTAPPTFTSATTYGEAVRAIVAAGVGAAVPVDIPAALAALPILDDGETLPMPLGTDLKTVLRDISDRVGALAYHDGLTGWLARSAAASTSTTAALVTGRRGLARSTESRRDRAEWGNAVAVAYRWRTDDGTEREVIGRAQQLTGPLGVETVGRKPVILSRAIPATQAKADAAAASILSRTIARARAIAVESARAVWWIRPGSAITVSTPDDPAQTATVAAVTFDLPAATMQVRTRIPEEA